MRVLLDEQVPDQLAPELVGHAVRTVKQMGWKGLTNGALLLRASAEFDVLVSMDRNMPIQQDMARFKIGLVVLRAPSNRIESLLPLVPAILHALTVVRPGTVETVGSSA